MTTSIASWPPCSAATSPLWAALASGSPTACVPCSKTLTATAVYDPTSATFTVPGRTTAVVPTLTTAPTETADNEASHPPWPWFLGGGALLAAAVGYMLTRRRS